MPHYKTPHFQMRTRFAVASGHGQIVQMVQMTPMVICPNNTKALNDQDGTKAKKAKNQKGSSSSKDRNKNNTRNLE